LSYRYHHLHFEFVIIRLVEVASFLLYLVGVAYLLVEGASCLEVEAFHLEEVAYLLVEDSMIQISKPSL
jgi:hypothetical protein